MIQKQPSKKWDSVTRVIVLIVVFGLWVTVAPETAFLWSVFLVWWAFRFDSRILAGVAIMFLVGTAVASALHADARAEQLAVYVYFLLLMVVALQILEYRREGGGDAEEEAEGEDEGRGEEGGRGAPCPKGAVHRGKVSADVRHAGREVSHESWVHGKRPGRAVLWVGPKKARHPEIGL